jgi:hypothetical protein
LPENAEESAPKPAALSGPCAVSGTVDPDDALRTAIKAALDAGDLARVKALVDVLEQAPARKPAAVLELVPRER